ncbi:MAG TPA: amidohydrolase [Candidatus Solibacter sp.]|nr:amidohydrolase [Candidatus Solibacter sp.]
MPHTCIHTRRAALALLCLASLLALGWAAEGRTKAPGPADVILLHARIYTVNRLQPWAEALTIYGDKIGFVGTEQQVARFRGPNTRVLDAGGRLVLPGITDAHVHFMSASLSLSQLDLNGANTTAEIAARVRSFAAKHPEKPWILGRGWVYSTFGAEALPHREMLDALVPDRPALLTAYDGHTSWANSRALALAGVTRDTPDPANGIIVHDPKTGEPTGALKEAAGQLVRRIIPTPSRDELLAAFRQGLAHANRLGITGVHSLRGDFENLGLFDQVRREGGLTLRMYVAYFAAPPELSAANLEAAETARRQYNDEWISSNLVKFIMDGVIEAHTAAMLAPYSDDPTLQGKTFWEPAKYKAAVAELDRRGFLITTHAIGDAAIRLALDAYQNANRANGTRDSRMRIEHIEDVSAADIGRFGSLGVIASMQPLHAMPDDNGLNVWARNVGPERAARAFAWNSISAAGGRLAYGSDWPVVTINPWEGMQIAVTRETPEGTPAGGWIPGERVTLEQAVEAYTMGSAYAGGREKTQGSLEAGKLADLIIVSQDIFRVAPRSIGKTEVMLTMVGGKTVYAAPAISAAVP